MVILLVGLGGPFSSAGADELNDDHEGKFGAQDVGRLPGFPIASMGFGASANGSLSLLVNDEEVFVRYSVEASENGIEGAEVDAVAGPTHVPPAEEERTPILPCQDPRGCPDLYVDSSRLALGDTITVTVSASNCAVEEGSTQPGERRLMRFTFTTPNLGQGDLIVGNPDDQPDLFEFAECHRHDHFVEYADYRLWELEGYVTWQRVRAMHPNASAESIFAANPHLMEGFIAGHKQGFCVIDIVRYVPTEPSTYRSCSTNQGMSRGWADEYHHTLPGQWIDVTDVSHGWYVLEAEVNPERVFAEADYSNNAGAILVLVTPFSGPPLPSPGQPIPIPPLPGGHELPPQIQEILNEFIEQP